MILLDTNIFIYLAKGVISGDRIAENTIAHASITKIEALGFGTIPANELLLLTSLFEESYALDMDTSVIDEAVRLRQAHRMSLGDSIIAATALIHELVLWTANTEDFKHIEPLRMLNPL